MYLKTLFCFAQNVREFNRSLGWIVCASHCPAVAIGTGSCSNGQWLVEHLSFSGALYRVIRVQGGASWRFLGNWHMCSFQVVYWEFLEIPKFNFARTNFPRHYNIWRVGWRKSQVSSFSVARVLHGTRSPHGNPVWPESQKSWFSWFLKLSGQI